MVSADFHKPTIKNVQYSADLSLMEENTGQEVSTFFFY